MTLLFQREIRRPIDIYVAVPAIRLITRGYGFVVADVGL